MPIRTPTAITVTTTATLLCQGKGDIFPTGCLLSQASATIYVGGSDVTSATGFQVAAADTPSFDLRLNDDLYGITASGTATVRVFKTRV